MNIQKPEAIDHQAINQISSQITALLVSALGTAIGKPSSFSPEPMVKFYALTGLSNDQDSYTMAVAAKAACLRVALSHLKSLFIGDELCVLFRKDGFRQANAYVDFEVKVEKVRGKRQKLQIKEPIQIVFTVLLLPSS